MPGNASGGMDGVALKPLTVDFHEPGFVGQIVGENGGGDDTLKTIGPATPQALNRYSYVQNNPLRSTDPKGHWTFSFGFTLRSGAFYGGSISTGVTWDSQGNVAGYTTTSDGGTIGAVAGASVGSSVTNATTIFQTEGPGKNVGVDIDVMGGGGADIPMGTNKEYSGVGVSVGVGIGIDGHIERTNTTLYKKADLIDDTDRISHNVSQWASDTKAGIKHIFCKASGWSGSRYGSYVGC